MRVRNFKILLPLIKIRRLALSNWYNHAGWKTQKKYVLFESDDWGSIRNSSPEAHQALIDRGDGTDQDPFTRYDALASDDDLELLFDVLTAFRDCQGNHPIITANCAVANPDFDKIRESNFEKYYFEPFTETLKRHKSHENSFNLWQSGMDAGIFYPQLHCREHLNINQWLSDLRDGNKGLRFAFDHHMISGRSAITKNNKFAYMDAFNYCGSQSDHVLEEIAADAVALFKEIFGYESRSYIASCYVWSDSLERILAQHKIEFIQGGNYQLLPTDKGYGHFQKKTNRIGDRNRYDQLYLIRNCHFEPSMGKGSHEVDLCLAQINNSFRWGRPATICTHRLNYVGFINKLNRDRNLPLLDELLSQILKRWPGVEFITSTELGDIIRRGEVR